MVLLIAALPLDVRKVYDVYDLPIRLALDAGAMPADGAKPQRFLWMVYGEA